MTYSRAPKLYLRFLFLNYLISDIKIFSQALRKKYGKFIVHIFAYLLSIFSVYNQYIISNQL
jgi:hypothetical protein